MKFSDTLLVGLGIWCLFKSSKQQMLFTLKSSLLTLILKKLINSPRPDGDGTQGFPSGHTQLPWSIIWYNRGNVHPFFLYTTYTISILRYIERRHYWYQILAGALLPGVFIQTDN
jgi:membrane-associated phospholipid phosphatase